MMKTIFFLLLSFTASAQSGWADLSMTLPVSDWSDLDVSLPPTAQPDWYDFNERWKFHSAITTPIILEAKGYVRTVIAPSDTATYIYTFSRVKKVWAAPLPILIIKATDYSSAESSVRKEVDHIGITPLNGWVKFTKDFGLKPYTKMSIKYAREDAITNGAITAIIDGVTYSFPIEKTATWQTYKFTLPVNVGLSGLKTIELRFNFVSPNKGGCNIMELKFE